MSATDRAFVEGFAGAHGLEARWEGTIGFGRDCVGLLDPERKTYIAWVEGTGPPDEVKHAYHKDQYIAVLGYVDSDFWDVEAELAAWVRKLSDVGVHFERLPKIVPDLSSLVFGHGDEMVALPGDEATRERAIEERRRLSEALS